MATRKATQSNTTDKYREFFSQDDKFERELPKAVDMEIGDTIMGKFIRVNHILIPDKHDFEVVEFEKDNEKCSIGGKILINMFRDVKPDSIFLLERIDDIPAKQKGWSPAKNYDLFVIEPHDERWKTINAEKFSDVPF